MNLEKVISSLRMNIEFGVDEAISEMPRNRLKEGVKENLLFKENFNRSVQKGSSGLSQIQLMQAPVTFDQKYEIACDLASKCDTIDELFKAINSFPYFIKNNHEEVQSISNSMEKMILECINYLITNYQV